MKHKFLLDENILYLAVKGVDEHDNPDTTAAELLRLIAQNCHSITIDRELGGRYWHHLEKLQSVRSPVLQPVVFITQFIKNSAKAVMEYSDPLELPPDATIPAKDVHVVRAALMSDAFIVTTDRRLREAVNSQATLGLRALSPSEAIELAKQG